jgi:hypothetical protein
MLSDIEPDLENVTYRHTVFPDNSTKDAFAVPWYAHKEVRFVFVGIPRKAQSLQNLGVQTHPRRRKLISRIRRRYRLVRLVGTKCDSSVVAHRSAPRFERTKMKSVTSQTAIGLKD